MNKLQAFLRLVDLNSVHDVSPERKVEDLGVEFDALTGVLASAEVQDGNQQLCVFFESWSLAFYQIRGPSF
jgi:hypothetical protein